MERVGRPHATGISEFDKAFGGTQCVFNWASDYELELGNACIKNAEFARMRIEFCTEYLNRVSDRNELNSLNMRRAIAESYFRMGKTEDGEREYEKLTKEHPTWGWGWIGWSDEYSDNKDFNRAIEILTQALKIEGVDEKAEIKLRLKEAYEGCGMLEEVKAIANEERKPPVHKERKIGRNEPCPCGSGNKYKRCCGA